MQILFQNSPNFGVKISTVSVFEATSGKIFGDNGIKGFREVINAFPQYMGNRKAAGGRGLVYYAQLIGSDITAKYPKIAETTAKINEIIRSNPNARTKQLQEEIFPLLEEYEKELDIII